MIEGRGMVAPAPEDVYISAGDVDAIRRIADERNKFRRYESRADAWGRGRTPDSTFRGILGEHALCNWLGSRSRYKPSIDAKLRKYGDGGRDIVINGLRIQVKARTHGSPSLVRRLDESKKLKRLDFDIVSFAFYSIDQRTPWQHVQLLGWVSTASLTDVATFERGQGPWWNLAVKDMHLESMSRLIEEIELRRAA